MNLYVSNLGFSVKDEDLNNMFAPFGEVTSAKVITDRITGQSRGFGFVEMSDDNAANEAIAALNAKQHDGRTISVNEARPREERGPRSDSPFKNNNSYKKPRW